MQLKHTILLASMASCFAGTAFAQEIPTTVTWTLDGAAQAVVQRNSYWGLAQQFAPATEYKRSFNWLEVYVKPGMRAERQVNKTLSLYGGASVVASGTLGQDLFEQGDTGRVLLEDAFVGLKGGTPSEWNYDFSVGAQPYSLGSGFLLGSGSGNGFERGAAITAPRRAWQMTAIAKAGIGAWRGEAFYLDANELKSGDSKTKLAGAQLVWSPDAQNSVGLAHLKVTSSESPYPQAPINIIENGRNGLKTTNLHWRYEPNAGTLAGFSMTGELATQSHSTLDMSAKGMGLEFAYRFASLPWMPRLSYSARYYSGDDPATTRLERFDPLFYDSAPNTWSSGGNGSFAFYNSNLVVHRIRVDLVLSPQDFANVSYWNVRAAQTFSPIQYGQGARLGVVNNSLAIISGVPTKALSQELYFEYTRVLNPKLFLTAGLALAFSEEGIKKITPNGTSTWAGGLLMLTYKY